MRFLVSLQFLPVAISLLGYPSRALIQSTASMLAEVPKQDLAQFEGTYHYRDGLTLFMVSNGSQLFALIEDSKYTLRSSGNDAFLNPVGDVVPFVRDSQGHIVAFKEHGETFTRRSTTVPASARLRLQPRAATSKGKIPRYRYKAPIPLADGIRIGRAGTATLSPEIAEQLVNGVTTGKYSDVDSLLIYHKGSLVLEEYFYGFSRQRPHGMISLSKSVISLLAGAAVDRELLRADTPVLDRLGYSEFQNADPRKAKITLLNLLANQSGLACNEHDRHSPGNEAHLFETADWAKAFVDLPMIADPGTEARYCSGGFFTTGRIIERVSGKPLPEFADEVLFKPLGIPRSAWKWNFGLSSSERTTFGQVYLTPRAMLKLGILIENRGIWQGRRVISSSWIDAAVGYQSHVDDSDYGLGIWHRWYTVKTATGHRRVDTVMLSGNGGQKVYLVPTLDLIAVSTGNAFFVESPMNEIMSRVLLPAFLTAMSKE
ncbi:MAG TPA: serine hydrolase [Candidatus Saccharimonadales bacterium]|nr:serine hydrolase [Candidatus Saccharimonadales bacterium]